MIIKEVIEKTIEARAMEDVEWAKAWALLQISYALKSLSRSMGDRMQPLETEGQGRPTKQAEQTELDGIDGIEVGDEGVRVTYKTGEKKFIEKEEGFDLYLRWNDYVRHE